MSEQLKTLQELSEEADEERWAEEERVEKLERSHADLLAELKETLAYLEGHHEALGHDNKASDESKRYSKCHTCAQIAKARAAIEKGEQK